MAKLLLIIVFGLLGLFSTLAKAQCQYDPYCQGWQEETSRQRENDYRMQQNDQWRDSYWQKERHNDSRRQPSPYSNDPYYDDNYYDHYDW